MGSSPVLEAFQVGTQIEGATLSLVLLIIVGSRTSRTS
jgi:hypothetical protein